MKLDRNTNSDGRGKYALLKLRQPLSDEGLKALEILEKEGAVHYGNEGPGEQFFVMKYKDPFTIAGLSGYANAAISYAYDTSSAEIGEWGNEVRKEAELAAKTLHKLPD